MRKIIPLIILSLSLVVWTNAQTFKINQDESKQRVDVLIDGKIFTSYRWEERIKRPVLLPIMTSGGNFVTRGFPVETRSGEDIGHPHQVGACFVYGDVNGVDFWNNSTFRTSEELKRMGKIVHRKITKTKDGKGKAELVTESEWIMPNGKTILTETTKFTFTAQKNVRIIDRETNLTAVETATFGDNKEGLFALHLSRELQQPSQTPEKITDEKGNISETTDHSTVTGEYFNSENVKGDKIWGTIGKWAAVSGKINAENISVAVFDHPKNYNYPSFMMVRGYGLLALNPFGKKAFDAKAEARKFVLEANKSVKFQHRLLIASEKFSPEEIEKEFRKFIK